MVKSHHGKNDTEPDCNSTHDDGEMAILYNFNYD